MKFFLIDQLEPFGVMATMAAVGTWSKGELCPECTRSTERMIPPLQIEWDVGSDVIGDFSWSGYTCAVTPRVVRALRKQKFECRFLPVQVLRPSEKARKSARRVPFPYPGPPLKWIEAKQTLPLDLQRSRVRTRPDHCSTCGHDDYGFKTRGLFVRRANWSGERIFRIRQFEPSDATFVTTDAVRLFQKAGFTNISFSPAGEIA